MSDELKEMFEELRDFDWLSTYQNFVDKIREKVEEEIKTSKQIELKKIEAEIKNVDLFNYYFFEQHFKSPIDIKTEIVSILNEHIEELDNE